jgi:predicted acyl esterase
MIQVQSSWFPLFALNPQKFMENPYKATKAELTKSFIKVFHNASHPSGLEIEVLRK